MSDIVKRLTASICNALLEAYPMGDKIADNYASLAAKVAKAEIEVLEAEVKKLNRIAADRQYMGWAYRSMLGEKGAAVAKMWDDKNVNRVHHSWGPEAETMTGEERAQVLLDWEVAFATSLEQRLRDAGVNTDA